jgi:hypothetical protein
MEQEMNEDEMGCTRAHKWIEGQARSNGTRWRRYEVCATCETVHSWGGDEATGEVKHSYRLVGYDEFGSLYESNDNEPPCRQVGRRYYYNCEKSSKQEDED